MELPVEIFCLVLDQLNMGTIGRLALAAQELRKLAWDNLGTLVLTPPNVVPICTYLMSQNLSMSRLRTVGLHQCFIPVWLGVPCFLRNVRQFMWTTSHMAHVINGAAPALLQVSIDPHHGHTEPGPEAAAARQAFKPHVQECLAALDPSRLEVVILDNERVGWWDMPDACTPLFENCCRAGPMTKCRTFRVKKVFSEGLLDFDHTLLKRLKESWTMPNLEVLEFDEAWSDSIADYYDEVWAPYREEDERATFEDMPDFAISATGCILSSVLKRTTPAQLRCVILRPSPGSERCDLFRGLGRWRPPTPASALDAFEARFGHAYGKFCVPRESTTPHKAQCLCSSLSHGQESLRMTPDERRAHIAVMHALRRCKFPTADQIAVREQQLAAQKELDGFMKLPLDQRPAAMPRLSTAALHLLHQRMAQGTAEEPKVAEDGTKQ